MSLKSFQILAKVQSILPISSQRIISKLTNHWSDNVTNYYTVNCNHVKTNFVCYIFIES